MSNDESKLTVFVSSMIGPLLEERAAVEEAIRTGIPLARTWVFERAPASSEAIAESYLARVRECDVYLLILGEDVSEPVKAEYRTAVECGKPRLCFVQEGVERTEALKGFLPILQADVKYATFTDEKGLRREVLRAVRLEFVRVYKAYYERLEAVRSAPFEAPTPVPHFQGRTHELAALLDHLQPGAAVTLCGPGGIGKTALAAEALAQLPKDRFPDGVIFHTFYRQPQAALALEHVARSYGLEPRPTPTDAARMALAGKRALLVLDGTEEADDLGAVLACAGRCGVLVTSRRRGDAPDPSLRFDLGPLEEDEAVALLRAWGGRRADDEQAAVAIYQLVGGLPLAIQLAGAYLSRTDEEAADYLVWLETTPLAALDFGQKQHQSVPVLMERSLERMSEKAQAALGLVGLMGFASFGREAIAAGLEIEEGEVGQPLGELVDYGLLTRQDGRYAVTHALVHTYARQRLSPEEEARENLASHYDFLIWKTDDHAILNAERLHLLAVLADVHRRQDWVKILEFAKDLDNWLGLQGHRADQVAVLRQALDAVRALDLRRLEGHYLGKLGQVYIAFGQAEKAFECFQQAMDIFQKIHDQEGEGVILGYLGSTYNSLGQVEKAIRYCTQALQIVREIGNQQAEGAILGELGEAHHVLGQMEKAIEYYQQALEIAREIGDQRNESKWLNALGNFYADLGQAEKAIGYYTQALEINREIGDRGGERAALGNLGLTYLDLGQAEKAIEYLQQVLKVTHEIGDRGGKRAVLSNLGIAYRQLGQVEKAIGYYTQALEIAREIGDRRGEGVELGHLGNAHFLGQVEKAMEYHQQALAISRETGDRRAEGSTLGNLGNAYQALGQVEKAIEHHQEALEIAREIGDRRGEGLWLHNLGIAYKDLGDITRARQHLSQALSIFEEIKSPYAKQARRQLAELD